MAAIQLSKDPELLALFAQWADAKRAADEAKEAESQIGALLRERLKQAAADGAKLVGAGGQLVATWTRSNETVIDAGKLLVFNRAAFDACVKEPKVDAAKLKAKFPAVFEQVAEVKPSDTYTLRLA